VGRCAIVALTLVLALERAPDENLSLRSSTLYEVLLVEHTHHGVLRHRRLQYLRLAARLAGRARLGGEATLELRPEVIELRGREGGDRLRETTEPLVTLARRMGSDRDKLLPRHQRLNPAVPGLNYALS